MTFTTRPTLSGTYGMVSSTHWIASQSAMRLLELGGNAYDAAVAAGFVLHVVEPHLNGPGGDLPAIVGRSGGTPQVLCGQGPAPAGATAEHFRAAGLTMVPGSGPLATAVPGAFDAWMLLLRDHGTMTPAQVLAPAEHYARHGHPLLAAVSATVERVADLFSDHWPTSAEVWLHGGRAPASGELHRNTAWADTLAALVRAGDDAGGSREARIEAVRAAWSQGFVAEAVDRFARRPHRHSGGQVLPGVVTGADLAAYRASWEEPVTLDWRGHTIAKTGPWGQGPTLLQVLQMAGDADPGSAEGVHRIVEAWKLAMADREAWFGDSADVPLEALLDPAYAAQRAGLIGAQADLSVRPGAPAGQEPRLAVLARTEVEHPVDATVGEPTVRRDGVTRGDTCHVDVVDRWGNMISATPSGGWLQSSPVVPELGFPLGSRLQMMWLEEGLPSSLVPGRRPRTTLSPTLVLRDGEPVLACGSPGGDQQDQWQSLFLLRHLAGGAGLQEAIDAPMFHTTSFPGSFYPRATEPGVLVAEERVGAQVLQALAERGHRLQVQGPWTLGRMCAVGRDPHTGVLTAGANPRGMQGYAVGR
ncbi:gamma-glutamyltransferase family protein [Ornithinimicrobium sediminis]|uniref:gamma-glutamyltransferase family protein n=1 Tax=Ornithinimicrobium sediminis TaxID=2904603 RepID=UPI001E3A27EF|nr:gamma-glutamyltransferase family protein [Ornithinimicrobium sediminis]MCE0485740.1 gamma-glutamyltransferase family protein [Ornithinimicrobium sediminis]